MKPGIIIDALLIFTGLACYDIRIALVTVGALFLAGARAGATRLPSPPPDSERTHQ